MDVAASRADIAQKIAGYSPAGSEANETIAPVRRHLTATRRPETGAIEDGDRPWASLGREAMKGPEP
jgi:hypothetical protein